jgi:hypothetical protein
MGFYIDNKGDYYQGDKAYYTDRAVPERPSGIHTWNGTEWVIDEVKKIEAEKQKALTDLVATDAGMSRVVEDLIALLIDRKVIKEGELPKIVKDKLNKRIEMRDKL